MHITQAQNFSICTLFENVFEAFLLKISFKASCLVGKCQALRVSRYVANLNQS